MIPIPYVITTHRHLDDPTGEFLPDALPGVTRRAVATLEEAHTAVNAAHPQASRDIHDLPGTVGPLPDGTVIEVKRVTWARLTHDAGLEPWHLLTDPMPGRAAQFIDAYNAREARA